MFAAQEHGHYNKLYCMKPYASKVYAHVLTVTEFISDL